MNDAGQIVSVAEARALLGPDAKFLSDQEVEARIEHVDRLAQLAIDMYKVQKSTKQFDLLQAKQDNDSR